MRLGRELMFPEFEAGLRNRALELAHTIRGQRTRLPKRSRSVCRTPRSAPCACARRLG